MNVVLREIIPDDWREVLHHEFEKPYFVKLQEFLEGEYTQHTIFPPREEIFNALALTPYEKVKVLILGQDPYHNYNQSHGLCFSVRPGIKVPPSLKNIYKELENDLGIPATDNGYLVPWTKQGGLLLNAVLTVRAHQANSHRNQGWETFTDEIITQVNKKDEPVVFVLWGNPARRKEKLIDTDRHVIISSAHPSPLSANRGFLNSKPFSKINNALKNLGYEPVDWRIEDSQMELGL